MSHMSDSIPKDALIVEADERISPSFEFFRGRGDTKRPGLLFFFHHYHTNHKGALRAGAARWIKHGYDLVQVLCPTNDSYLSITDDEIATAKEFADRRGYRTRFTTGASMGGFGAILMSEQLDATRVLSLAPRWVKLDDKGRGIGTAGAADLEALAKRGGRSLGRTGPKTEVILFFDPHEATDANVAAYLRQTLPKGRLRMLPIRNVGHYPGRVLVELNLHPAETSNLLQTGDLPSFRKMIVRTKSKSMMLGLARRLAEKGHLLAAGQVYGRPICHSEPDNETHIQDRFAVLSLLDRNDELAQVLNSVNSKQINSFISFSGSKLIVEAAIKLLPDDVIIGVIDSWRGDKQIDQWRSLRFGELAKKLGKWAIAKAFLQGHFHPGTNPQKQSAILYAEMSLELHQPKDAFAGLNDWLATQSGEDLGWPVMRVLGATQKMLAEADETHLALEAAGLFLKYRDDGWMRYHRASLLVQLGHKAHARQAIDAARRCLPDDPALRDATESLLAALNQAPM